MSFGIEKDFVFKHDYECPECGYVSVGKCHECPECGYNPPHEHAVK